MPSSILCGSISVALLLSSARGQEPAPKPVDVEAASLPLRTALFHDPTLAPPLERLLQLYRDANRVKELVDVYRQHVTQYPADTGATIVLIRLLNLTGDADAGKLARAAAARFPEQPYLQYLLFEAVQKAHEPGALDALDRAIAKETLPARKRTWIDQLLPLAIAEGRPEVAQRHLAALAAASPSAEGKLEAARKMISHKLYAPALTALEAAVALKPAAETGVDLELAAASAELGLDREAAAATRLDRLLARLAADYWRRTEILHRRTSLVKSDADREAMLAAARARLKAAPADEGAALEVAQLQAAFEFRREALDVLLAASQRLPASEKIEKAALDLFDLLRDERGREAFLAERLRVAPQRPDLALARARSLFLLNRRSEALAVFDAFAAPLEVPARLTQTLELARFLRRSSLPADAAALFERAVALAPGRLEIRRELAETWLATGQKQKVREVFAGPLPEETETENLLDVIQFFLKQEMFTEARAALAARLAKEPQNFDLRLMEINVDARLADRAAGEELIGETLALADTDARYRRWLEGAVAFHEAFETHENFLGAELERLLGAGGWTKETGARRLVFADVAATHGAKSSVADMIAVALSEDLPAELRIELRRRQLAMIEITPAQSVAAEQQLRALEKEDPARADEYRIRLAMLASRAQQTQAVQALLGTPGSAEKGIDVQKVGDAALLAGLENVLRQLGGAYGKMIVEILERITTLEPTNRGAWERWLVALASSGDEEHLRSALRRLLEGVDRLPITEETRPLLRAHLLGSYWRALAGLLRDELLPENQLTEALPMLDSAGRLADQRDEWMWIAWTRAYVLNRLGRREARDESIRELERVASLPEPDAPKKKPTPAMPGAPAPEEDKAPPLINVISFPDGLVFSLGQARELLTAAPAARLPALLTDAPALRGELKARWAFETDASLALAKVLPLDPAHLLVIDGGGKLYVVETATGKLTWSRDGAKPLMPPRSDYNSYATSFVSPAVPVVAEGRLFLPTAEGIECWSAEGKVLWRASGLTQLNTALPVYPTLFWQAGQLLVCEPTQARLSSLEAATGKLRWTRDYPRASAGGPLHGGNSGASLSEGRLLLYGAAAVIVSATTGDVLWSFDAARARTFPVSLAETPAALPPPPSSSRIYGMGRSYSIGSSYAFSSYYGRSASNFMPIAYQTMAQGSSVALQPGQSFALVNTAASWAAGANGEAEQRRGLLIGQRLLLFSNNGARSLRLDLPFTSQQLSASGTVVGVAGHFACLLAGANVYLADFDTGTVTSLFDNGQPVVVQPEEDGDFDVAPVQPQTNGTLRVALDGALVYVSDPTGVTGYHIRTRQRVFHAPWPKSVAPPPPPDPAQAAAMNLQMQQQLQMQQRLGGATEPLTGLVLGGVLYTESQPGRLVALVGTEPHP